MLEQLFGSGSSSVLCAVSRKKGRAERVRVRQRVCVWFRLGVSVIDNNNIR